LAKAKCNTLIIHRNKMNWDTCHCQALTVYLSKVSGKILIFLGFFAARTLILPLILTAAFPFVSKYAPFVARFTIAWRWNINNQELYIRKYYSYTAPAILITNKGNFRLPNWIKE
jgi:hypothetical protein